MGLIRGGYYRILVNFPYDSDDRRVSPFAAERTEDNLDFENLDQALLPTYGRRGYTFLAAKRTHTEDTLP